MVPFLLEKTMYFIKKITLSMLLITTLISCSKNEPDTSQDITTLTDNERLFTERKQKCAKDDMVACLNLGFMHAKGKGTEKNNTASIPLFKKTCDANVKEGCMRLGFMYHHARGT